MSYAAAVQRARRAQPASIAYEPLEGEYDPDKWVGDVYESIGDRIALENDGNSEPLHSTPIRLFELVLGTVQEMLACVPFDRPGPNPAGLAYAITQRLLAALKKR